METSKNTVRSESLAENAELNGNEIFIASSRWLFGIIFLINVGAYELNFSQPAFTCSKLTIDIIEQGVKYVQS